MQAQRRHFLLQAARLSAALAVPLCGRAAPAEANKVYPFSLGVASGSPLPNAVMLWTRLLANPLDATSVPPVALTVRWEVAEDEAFRQVAARGTAIAAPELAHSLHVDARGLKPGRWYWYRFMLGDAVSPVGRTRTAPALDAMPDKLRLAVASCQHWEFGSYAAHRHIAAEVPDLVAFLGDYIYEWGPAQLRHPDRPQRVNESFTLPDYHARYAQYKSDPDLQAAHLAAPWIVTWDDHEVANDYAGVRDWTLSPTFAARRAAAYQAFYEHMPVRLADVRKFFDVRMYQRYDWGRLARFHMLDDRQYRSPESCPKPGHGGSNVVNVRSCTELRDPSRTMLGQEQEDWLEQGLRTSTARWNILAQQTLMAQNTYQPILTPEDGRFWTDGWDGYPAARRRLLDTLASSGAANPLVLGGDVHTFFATELRADFYRPASAQNPVLATELCGTSVTSNSRPQEQTLQYLKRNPHIKYGRSDKRGYMLVEVTPSATNARFVGLDDVRDAKSQASDLATFRVTDGRPGLEQLS